jgi:hypothetical protein
MRLPSPIPPAVAHGDFAVEEAAAKPGHRWSAACGRETLVPAKELDNLDFVGDRRSKTARPVHRQSFPLADLVGPHE